MLYALANILKQTVGEKQVFKIIFTASKIKNNIDLLLTLKHSIS